MLRVVFLLLQIHEPYELGGRKGAAALVELVKKVENLRHGQPGIEGSGLELYADAFLDGDGVARLSQPQQRDGAGIGGPQPLDHFNGGGLAGAVGTQHAEDLAVAYCQTDTVYRPG